MLITGASRGIGHALAREYLTRGARVFAAVRDPARAPALTDLAGVAGDRLVIVPLDVRSPTDIADAGDLVAAHSGGLDLLVNNAGVGAASPQLADVDGERMLDLLSVNTVGPILVTQRFLPLLRTGGRVVNITMPTRSVGRLAATGNHAFIASRFALNALTKIIATELADSGLIVAALWPGYLRTDLNDHAEAATPLETAIPGVVDVIEGLDAADHGACVRPDGTHHDW